MLEQTPERVMAYFQDRRVAAPQIAKESDQTGHEAGVVFISGGCGELGLGFEEALAWGVVRLCAAAIARTLICACTCAVSRCQVHFGNQIGFWRDHLLDY
jgi:hypothetical protein